MPRVSSKGKFRGVPAWKKQNIAVTATQKQPSSRDENESEVTTWGSKSEEDSDSNCPLL